MIRQPKAERQGRLARKTLDQAALTQLQNDFACFPFASRAILEMIHATFEPVWQSPANLKPGPMCVLAIAASEPTGKPLTECQFKLIVITLHSPEDEALRPTLKGRRVIPELRRANLGLGL